MKANKTTLISLFYVSSFVLKLIHLLIFKEADFVTCIFVGAILFASFLLILLFIFGIGMGIKAIKDRAWFDLILSSIIIPIGFSGFGIYFQAMLA